MLGGGDYAQAMQEGFFLVDLGLGKLHWQQEERVARRGSHPGVGDAVLECFVGSHAAKDGDAAVARRVTGRGFGGGIDDRNAEGLEGLASRAQAIGVEIGVDPRSRIVS